MVGIARLLPRNYLFTILGIAVGVSGLVAQARCLLFAHGESSFVSTVSKVK